MNIATLARNLEGFVKVSSKKGPLELLGLFLREESSELWDLVVAAPWLKANERSSFEYIANQLRKLLNDKELAGLSRIVILEHGGAVLHSFLEQFANHIGLVDVQFVSDGAVIRQAYIIFAGPVSDRNSKKSPQQKADPQGQSRSSKKSLQSSSRTV
jgi:hypothetical protein